MSNTLWLITEDENDYKIVRRLIEKLKLRIEVRWRSPTGKTPGLSRLAADLPDLIADVKNRLEGNDCIVVLHDQDSHTQPIRTTYDRIRDVCRTHGVKEVIAQDEIEAWLLSDSGICDWLGKSIKPWNGTRRPSDTLATWLRAKNRKYPRHLDDVLANVNGDGTNHSLQAAIKALRNAPCVKDNS